MNPVTIIARKRDGHELAADEIAFFIGSFSAGTVPDYQMAALAMAIYLQGMTDAETTVLTACMLASGKKLEWQRSPSPSDAEIVCPSGEPAEQRLDGDDTAVIQIRGRTKQGEGLNLPSLVQRKDTVELDPPAIAPPRVSPPVPRPKPTESTLLLDDSARIDSPPERALGGRDTTEISDVLAPPVLGGHTLPEQGVLDGVWFSGSRLELESEVNDTADFGNIAELMPVRLRLVFGPVVDKHSTGGLGDKTSLILAPLLACCGLRVPMISGRGLGATGGTLDKLEAIPGFRTNLSLNEIRTLTNQVGCVITGASPELAPVDQKLYALRDVTGTVASIPLITASIMSKKLAEGLNALVLDVKFGSGAFMKTLSSARKLAAALVETGQRMNVKTSALLTNMDQPLGRMVGNSLEVDEALSTLAGQGPSDLWEVTSELAADLLLTTNTVSDRPAAKRLLEQHLQSGRALAKFVEMVAAQGGNLNAVRRRSATQTDIVSSRSGFVARMNAEALGLAVIELGGGRRVMTDRIDHGVGLEMLVRIGDRVELGQPLVKVFASESQCNAVKPMIRNAIHIREEPVTPPLLISERMD